MVKSHPGLLGLYVFGRRFLLIFLVPFQVTLLRTGNAARFEGDSATSEGSVVSELGSDIAPGYSKESVT